MTRITETPESKCPHCKRAIDRAGSAEGNISREDDISICIYCQAILVFNKDMTLRIMEEEEWHDLPSEIQMIVTIERIRCLMAKMETNASMN